MSAGSPRNDPGQDAFRDLLETFDELVRSMDHALEQLGPEQAGSEEWHRLHRAKQAAERGAALARSQLPRN